MKNNLIKFFLSVFFLFFIFDFKVFGFYGGNVEFTGPLSSRYEDNIIYELSFTNHNIGASFESKFSNGIENLKIFCEDDRNRFYDSKEYCRDVVVEKFDNKIKVSNINENLKFYISGTVRDKNIKFLEHSVKSFFDYNGEQKVKYNSISTRLEGSKTSTENIVRIEDTKKDRYLYTKGGSNVDTSTLVKKIFINDELAYCEDPSKPLSSGIKTNTYTKEVSSDFDEKALISIFGYGYKGHKNSEDDLLLAVTQYALWGSDGNPYRTYISPTDKNHFVYAPSKENFDGFEGYIEFPQDKKDKRNDYDAKIKEFIELYKNISLDINLIAQDGINFDSTEKKLVLSESDLPKTIEFTGDEIVLNAFKNGHLKMVDGITASVNGNKLTIQISDSIKQGIYENFFGMIPEKYVGETERYISDTEQPLVKFRVSNPDYKKLTIEIQKSKKGNIVTKFVDEEGNDISELVNGDSQNINKPYNTIPKDIPGYTLKIIPDNSKGNIIDGTITVTYVYTKNKTSVTTGIPPSKPDSSADGVPPSVPKLKEDPRVKYPNSTQKNDPEPKKLEQPKLKESTLKEKNKVSLTSFLQPKKEVESKVEESHIKVMPKKLPKTGALSSEEIVKKVGISKNSKVDTRLPSEKTFKLAGSKEADLKYWLEVVPKQDKNSDRFIVLPSQGLVMPVNSVFSDSKSYKNFTNGKSEDFSQYLQTGAVEVPVSKNGYGEVGNKVIAGHSSYWYNDKGRYKTHFQKIIGMETGEEIWIYEKDTNGKYTRYVYKVNASYNTKDDDTSVLLNTKESTLTLFTCTPIGGTVGRWIVKADFIGN